MRVERQQVIEDLEALDIELGCVSSDRVAEALESRRQGLLGLLGSRHSARRRFDGGHRRRIDGARWRSPMQGNTRYPVSR